MARYGMPDWIVPVTILIVSLLFIFLGSNIFISFNLVLVGLVVLVLAIVMLAGPVVMRGRRRR